MQTVYLFAPPLPQLTPLPQGAPREKSSQSTYNDVPVHEIPTPHPWGHISAPPMPLVLILAFRRSGAPLV